MAFDIARIDDKLDLAESGSMKVTGQLTIAGIAVHNLNELVDFAKVLSKSRAGIPGHLRENTGGCIAILLRAARWGFDPFFVAEKSYLMNKSGEEKIAFEGSLFHAVIEAHAPLKGRVRCRYEGEGDARVCIVYATPLHELEPLEYRTPPLGKLKAHKKS